MSTITNADIARIVLDRKKEIELRLAAIELASVHLRARGVYVSPEEVVLDAERFYNFIVNGELPGKAKETNGNG